MQKTLALLTAIVGLSVTTMAAGDNIGSLKITKKTDTSVTVAATLSSSYPLVDQNIHRPFDIKWIENPIDIHQYQERTSEQPEFTIVGLKPNRVYLIVVQAYTKGGFFGLKMYRKVGDITVKTDPASASYCPPATWYNGTIPASYDGANCFIRKVPTGASAFLYSGAYYVAPLQGAACQISLCKCPAGTFDTRNCYIVAKPATGFIWQNGFYQKAGPGHSCPTGWTFDTANCFYMKAPWGTQAFEYQGGFYTTRLPYCAEGSFDGANCYLGKPPAGRKPFIYQGGFYYE
jgi:hypothetical protein